MKLFARAIVSAFFFSVLLLSFQNCASYSENSLFESQSTDVVDLSRPSVGSPVFASQSAIDLRDPINPTRWLVLKGTCYTAGVFDASFSLKLEHMQDRSLRNLCGASAAGCSEITGIRCNQGSYVIQVPLSRDSRYVASSYRGIVQMTYRASAGGGIVNDSRYSSFFTLNILDQ